MKTPPSLTLNEISTRWGMNRVTVRRTLVSYDFMGAKFGRGKTASVRYKLEDVEEAESLASKSKKGLQTPRGEIDFPNQTLKMIGQRWNMHPTTARDILHRFGRKAFKFGNARSTSVRFTRRDVEEVERLAAMNSASKSIVCH